MYYSYNAWGETMDKNLEAVKYLSAKKVSDSIQKHGFKVEDAAEKIISSANPEDILSVRVTINSPLTIVKAVNVTSNPDDIFAVVEE